MFSKWFKSKVPVNDPTSPERPQQAANGERTHAPSAAQGDLFGAQEPVAAEPVKSPCNGVCDMDWQNNVCIGCFRTPHEIGSWRGMSEADKRKAVAAAEKRAQELSA